MNVSIFSVIMAVLWFDAFILLSSTLRRKTNFLLQYSLLPLIILILFGLTRVLLPLEMPFATVFHSHQLLPILQGFWLLQVSLWGGLHLSVAWMVVLICMAVSVILLIRFFYKIHLGNQYIEVLYTEEDERAKLLLQEIVDQTKPGQDFAVRIAPDLSSPIVTGLFRPVILMPEDVKSLSDQQLLYILRHEWSHYLSKDLWVKLLIHLLCCVMWWNPPIFLLRKDLDQVLELSCDHRVTREMPEIQRVEYLNTIMEVLKQFYGRENPLQKAGVGVNFIGAGRGAPTIQRFLMVYDQKKCIASWKTNLISLFIMAVLFLLSFSFIVQPYTPTPKVIQEETPDNYNVMITPENSYLTLNDDGSYSLFLCGYCTNTLSKAEIQKAPYNVLPIKEE
jgi:beta-lactamase regulating signal transducer with metallopeptidase domain